MSTLCVPSRIPAVGKAAAAVAAVAATIIQPPHKVLQLPNRMTAGSEAAAAATAITAAITRPPRKEVRPHFAALAIRASFSYTTPPVTALNRTPTYLLAARNHWLKAGV